MSLTYCPEPTCTFGPAGTRWRTIADRRPSTAIAMHLKHDHQGVPRRTPQHAWPIDLSAHNPLEHPIRNVGAFSPGRG